MALSKELSSARSLDSVQNGNLGKAYLPADARSRALHGLGPGAGMTAEALREVLVQMDQFLVVDDYGSVECVKFAREEYNKRCWVGGRVHMMVRYDVLHWGEIYYIYSLILTYIYIVF